MKEKVIVAVLAASVLAAGVLVFIRRDGAAKPHGKTSGERVADSVVGEAEKLADESAGLSGASSLPSDIQAFVVVKPRNIDAAIKRWESTRDKVTATGVWKKFDLGNQLQEKFQEGFNQGVANNPGGPGPEKVRAELAALFERWKGLDEMMLVVSPKTANYAVKDKEMPLPGVLFQFAFTDARLAKDSFELFSAGILEGKESFESPEITAAKKSDAEIELRFRGGSAPEKNLPATVRVDGTFVQALFNAAPGDFRAASGGTSFAGTPEWRNAAAVSPETASVFSFVNLEGIVSAVDRIVDVLPPGSLGSQETIDELKNNLEVYREFDSLWFGIDAGEGLKVTSCVLPRSGTSFGALYDTLFESRASGKPLISQTPLLIDAQTIFAAGLSVDTLASSLVSIKEQVKKALSSPKDDEESKNISALLDAAEKAVNEVKVKEIGLFIAPPLMPPIVGAGVILGGSELSGEALLKQLAASINDLSRAARNAIGDEPAADIAEVVAGTEGVPELKLNAGGLLLTGSAAKDHSVIISVDSAIVSTMAKRLDAPTGYLEKLQGPPGLGKLVGGSDYFIYLNTATVIDLARNYLPLLLAQQPQEPKVDAADANEILDLLKFSYLSFQRSYRTENKAVCSDSRAYVFP